MDRWAATVDRRLGSFLAVVTVFIVAGVARNSPKTRGEAFLGGVEIAVALSSFLLSIMFFWGAWLILRRLDAPRDYWIGLEKRFRPMFGRLLTLASVLGLGLGAFAVHENRWEAGGIGIGIGGIFGALVLAARFGLITPTDRGAE